MLANHPAFYSTKLVRTITYEGDNGSLESKKQYGTHVECTLL